MTVLTDNVFGIRNDSAINELVVIRILLNQTKSKLWIKALTERAFQYCIDNVLCDVGRSQLSKNLCIFRNDIVANAKKIAPLTKASHAGR